MISVVLPTYNGISYIKNSVTSILEQTYTDLELIIVDDCSTDGTGDVVDALAKSDDRIHVIHNSVNKKLPASLNIGFENAKGNYYTWTSDDNLYKHDALEVMLNHLKESPNTDIVYAMYDTIDSDGNIITNDNNDSQSCPEENGILHNWVGACFLYKREVHDRLYGYDENLFLVEDFDFWLRAARYFTYKRINKNLYQYRVHKNSLTSTRNSDIMAKTVALLQREIEKGYVPPDKLAPLYKHFVNYYYAQTNYKEFKKYMRLLKESGNKKIKINISYRLAEVTGIRAIKKIWRFRYFFNQKIGEVKHG